LLDVTIVNIALPSIQRELHASSGELEGVGGAIMSALALSILSETYSGKARAGAIGIWATVAGLGFGLGPVVGGRVTTCGTSASSSSAKAPRTSSITGRADWRTESRASPLAWGLSAGGLARAARPDAVRIARGPVVLLLC
jgi:MFS family permease